MFVKSRSVFLLACLSWAAHSRRVQPSTKQFSSGAAESTQLKPLADLLLGSDPAAAFHLASPVLPTVNGIPSKGNPIATTLNSAKLAPTWHSTRTHLGGLARSSNVQMLFERFSERAIKAILNAQEEARRLGHNFVSPEMLLIGIATETTSLAAQVMMRFGITVPALQANLEQLMNRGNDSVQAEVPFTKDAKRILERCVDMAQKVSSTSTIDSSHILVALLADQQQGQLVALLNRLDVDPMKLKQAVIDEISEEAGTTQKKVPSAAGARMGKSSRSGAETLEKFATDLTKKAAEGKLDPVIGRAQEVERTIQVLARRRKNNPILIGEPGVGKTSIAEGLAQRIVEGNVPKFLKDKKIMVLDLPGLLAGTKFRGEFEERLNKVIKEVVASERGIILMIDEIHMIVGAGNTEGAIDAGNLMKPQLASGEMQVIGATTIDEYRKYIEKDKALERRFQQVEVPEPSVDEAIQILKGLSRKYEAHHQLRYTPEAVEACVKFADQYIADRFLPDKAIDVLDETGARVRLQQYENAPKELRDAQAELREVLQRQEDAVKSQDYKTAADLKIKANDQMAKVASLKGASDAERAQVTEPDVARVVAEQTGIPVDKVSADESARLMDLEGTLHNRVIGQDEAVTAVAKAVRRARAGLKNPNRPIASFIFCGPTGVGKTELTKALAEAYFGKKDAMIRFDMSEYMERHTVSKLIGSPPGYVGYDEESQLTDRIRRHPYSLILFDEVEKAHPDVFNLMLQILEDGRLTDSRGRVVSFKNALIIMTSNAGAQGIEKAIAGGASGLGFANVDDDEETASYQKLKEVVSDSLQNVFKPEFINRLDEVIVFRSLTKPQVAEIAELEFKKLFQRVAEMGMTIELTEKFKEKVLEEGFNPAFGARPLRRAISQLLEDELAASFLSQPVAEGEIAIIDVDDNGKVVVLRKDENAKEVEGEAELLRNLESRWGTASEGQAI